MNVAESMKNVLKHKGHIFTDHWKEDFSFILKDVSDDLSRMVKHLKSRQRMKTSLFDGLTILKILPHRVVDGFIYFKEDFLLELESLPDQKQKSLYSMKVLGALTSFTLGAVYNVKMGNVDVQFKGIKSTTAFGKFIVAEVVFKILRLYLLRFFNEVEKELSTEEDINRIRYFKGLLTGEENSDESHVESTDSAIEIVNKLKKYIMTGKREFD